MKKLIAIYAFIFTIISLPATALDLQSARTEGVLGEKNDGTVSVLKASPEATALANEVNSRRKEEYQNISKANGQPLNIVSKVAAEEIINKLPAGAKYQNASGKWLVK